MPTSEPVPTDPPLLAVSHLTSGYGDLAATRNLSFELRAGELTALMGANGAGKTATLLAIMGVNDVHDGSISVAGQDVTSLPVTKRVKAGVSLVLEGRRLFPALTVRENLEIAGSASGHPVAERLERVLALFPLLVPLMERVAGALSGGEQQACALGRGLMAHPRLLLVDELSLGLAPVVVDVLLDALTRVHDEFGATVLFVEQNTDRALSVATRAIVLSRGEKVLDGPAADIAERREELERAFLGVAA
jgi:branched-chain amino acid transport system ATP-binding protein